MTPNTPSLIQSSRVERAMMARCSPMPELTMELLATWLNEFRRGHLRPAARVWDVMVERDGELGGVKLKRQADPARLPYEIVAMEDTPEAQRHAEALEYAYANLRTTHALDQDVSGNVRTLLHQIGEAHTHRYSVHEMRLRIDSAARKEVTVELTQCPVWWFEARTGRLRFLPEEGSYEGIPMEPGQWLRAVGHGHMRACSVAYLTKWMPMSAWMLYTHRFGVPGIHGKTDAKEGTPEWVAFVNSLFQFANDYVTATNRGTEIGLIEASGTADAPFRPIIEYVDRLYAKLYRGGDLSTNSRDNQAVGASLQGSESDAILQDDAAWLTETLNEQLDRPLIRYLFGAEPLAFFRLNPPRIRTVDSDIKSAEFLTSHGVRVSTSEMIDRLGFREAEDDEDALGTPAAEPPPDTGTAPADATDPSDPPDPTALGNESDDLASRALAQIAQAAADDMAPIRAELERISALEDLPARRAALLNLMDSIPDFARTVLKAPRAAGPLADLLGTAYVNGLATRGADRKTAQKKTSKP